MTLSTGFQVKHERSGRRFDIAPPAWVRDWTGADVTARSLGGMSLTIARGPSASLVGVTVPRAAALPADRFEERTNEVYRAIQATLATLPHRAPVRFWNYLPAIHEPLDESRDRYMVFNAGRYGAMSDWFGELSRLCGRVPAASSVGHWGDELVVDCLACAESGEAVENPRQVPAWRYSHRYGPLPPCFSRATVIDHPRGGGRALLVAGTASILGEHTVHAGDVCRQLQETLANLAALLDTVRAGGRRWGFTDLRAYYVRQRDAAMIRRLTGEALGPEVNVQMVHADLCRADLLVEIEGLARPGAGACRE